jgi:hypothetical protein
MKKYGVILGSAVIFAVVAFSLGAWAVGPNAQAGDALRAPSTPDASQDFAMSETPPGGALAAAASQTVYFFPLDTDTSTTVIFLANTGSTTATIYRYCYRSDSSLYDSGWTTIPAGVATVRASDDTTAGDTVWNFTAATAYVRLVMPDTIAIDGYVAYRSSTSGLFDISTSTNMRPLRFITMP